VRCWWWQCRGVFGILPRLAIIIAAGASPENADRIAAKPEVAALVGAVVSSVRQEEQSRLAAQQTAETAVEQGLFIQARERGVSILGDKSIAVVTDLTTGHEVVLSADQIRATLSADQIRATQGMGDGNWITIQKGRNVHAPPPSATIGGQPTAASPAHGAAESITVGEFKKLQVPSTAGVAPPAAMTHTDVQSIDFVYQTSASRASLSSESSGASTDDSLETFVRHPPDMYLRLSIYSPQPPLDEPCAADEADEPREPPSTASTGSPGTPFEAITPAASAHNLGPPARQAAQTQTLTAARRGRAVAFMEQEIVTSSDIPRRQLGPSNPTPAVGHNKRDPSKSADF